MLLLPNPQTLHYLLRHVATVSVVALLAACAGDKDQEYAERPVGELYGKAIEELNDRNYVEAARAFDEVERQHPYSTWATKAQLMSAYAYYEDAKYDDAIIALDRFIQLHPGNVDTPYAYYLKSLCYYEQISDVGRDQKMTDMARSALEDVINRFPGTSYARDARLKLDLTLDHLAGKEMEVGRWYLRHQKYLAAINRFLVVINQYDRTSHAPEALYRLTESYTVLGLKDEAKKTAAVLGHNYPGSDWYDDAYDLVERGETNPEANNAALDEGGEGWWDSITDIF
ncbi:outer membrane protein assembly factor BamD [Haematospirillum jordaniae]|uniref:Outer membrane protein assembly factor BamD n=1 Tax=Haematospirillum jordaniae TaxID=1549855 RepID=A0A143DFD5_9PROT|nr:outer membrane protein assembly factor BamD [Haematospirillum jordaniae]AMW34818.1 transporter [Haematospirillum jordaniae]NKD45433.1 outer membrane protein assembly factor BamD [Haematospirillum jordaniae]NKD56817.1 outer membrane protein assembly factor BamD [Haematospirillum jordaniae]NKD59027.1 outer membrane protein assembly factor BamD [Haematospirillum jordaniae]NKD66741.1 outer membrane protein assembly factor BamD [Haematospirillum jordaniae]